MLNSLMSCSRFYIISTRRVVYVCQVLHSFIHFTHLKQCARLFSRPGEDCALWEHGLPEG